MKQVLLQLFRLAFVIALYGSTAGVGQTAGANEGRPPSLGSLPHSASKAHASAALAALHSASGVPGLAAAVSVEGEIVWEEYAGLRDLDSDSPVSPDTRFRIGSVSKAVTAVALARLWQADTIDLDADVRRYVPTFPDKGALITPRLLAGHLAGIRNYEKKDFTDSEHIDRRHFATTEGALAIFADDPLVAPPGQRYHYSVFGYTLLSAAMEGASGETFLALLHRTVLDPLGLRNTGADSSGGSGRATPYERTPEGGATVAAPLDFSYKWAGGGLSSTVRDLTRLGSALLDPEFLSPESLEMLATSQVTLDGRPTEVGLGWRLGSDSRGRRFLHHAGTITGGRAVILVYRDQGVSVAITSNQALAPLLVESTAQVLAEPFLLQREGRRSSRARPAGTYTYTWTARGEEHTGNLRYGPESGEDRIDLHPDLARWAAGLGCPMEGSPGSPLPMLLTGNSAFIPVITPAGAFAIDVTMQSDGGLAGMVTGQFARVAGPFRAERMAVR